MSKTRVVVSVNCVFQLNSTAKKHIIILFNVQQRFPLNITLIGISAKATGQPQSLNTLSKNITYLESISLRNRLLTYWSVTMM